MPQFSSYATDPNYATAFTITWASAAALCALVALPGLVRSARQGQLTAGLRGLGEDFEHKAYQPIADDGDEKKLVYADTAGSSRPASTPGWGLRARGWAAALGTLTLYSPPYVGLDLGQSECFACIAGKLLVIASIAIFLIVFVILGYLVTLMACILHKSQLRDNGNRAGQYVSGALIILQSTYIHIQVFSSLHSYRLYSSSLPRTMSSPC